MNYECTEIISLIGKSEKNKELVEKLTSLKVKFPIKRPRRDENYTNVVCSNFGLEFVFEYMDEYHPEGDHDDGEMLLSEVFFRPLYDSKGLVVNSPPYDLSWSSARKLIRKKLGEPYWTSPMLNNDKWRIGDLFVLIVFDDGELSISEIIVGLG